MSVRSAIGKNLPLVLIAILLVLALTFGWFIMHITGGKDVQQKKMVQQVTMVQPTPPPPPPPPPEEKPPEPEQPEEMVEQPVDEALPDQPMDDMASQDLGIDGDASAGGDGFGLQARKGGSGLLGGGSPYAVEVQSTVTDALTADDRLKHLAYVAILKLWVDQDGRLKHYEIQQKEGDPKIRELLKTALASLTRFGNPPPLEMPQPIKLRIRSQL